jgi:hypothetical protein
MPLISFVFDSSSIKMTFYVPGDKMMIFAYEIHSALLYMRDTIVKCG